MGPLPTLVGLNVVVIGPIKAVAVPVVVSETNEAPAPTDWSWLGNK